MGTKSKLSATNNPPFALPAWLAAAAIIAAIALTYLPVRHAGFIWDDDAHVTTNPVIIGPQGLTEIWTSAKANYFPLTMTSFWVQHAAFGLNPVPYHWVNVGFHAAGAVMLWLILRRLRVPSPWLGAMLWALHPVQTESVAWISELKNTQSGFFYLLSVWFFVRWLEGPRSGPRSTDLVWSWVAALLAILSKSSTVMLPVVLGLISWWRGRDFRRELLRLLPFVAISLVASGWTIWEQKVNSMASGAEWGHGLGARLVIAGQVPWFYLGKLIWPEPLIFIYPRWDPAGFTLLSWLPLAALIATTVFLWRQRNGAVKAVFLGLGYFAISLFPVLGLFDVFFFRYSFVGDHFQYLASMGPLVLLGVGLRAALARWLNAGWRLRAGLAACAVVGLGWRTHSQARIYESDYTLWSDTVARNPNAWIARVNLGVQLEGRGEMAAALAQYEAAVQMKPLGTEVEVNHGNVLLRLGRAAEAIPHFERAVAGGRALPQARHGLGLSLFATGRAKEAVPHLEEAVRLSPDEVWPLVSLADAYAATGRTDEAVALFRRVTSGKPSLADAHGKLALLLLRLGRPAEAIPEFEATLRLGPAPFEVPLGLAHAWTAVGRRSEALALLAELLRVNPDLKAARELQSQITAQPDGSR